MDRLVRVMIGVVLVLGLATPAAAAQPRDRRAPAVRFTTANDDVIVAAPADTTFTRVRGTATDRGGSGVKAVRVIFCGNARRFPDGGYTCGSTWPLLPAPVSETAADLNCVDARRRLCTWSANVPLTPGHYVAIATATDRAGNKRIAKPIFVTVV